MLTASQTDMFATKGIEYLLVIGFLLVLALFWRALNRSTAALSPAVATGEGIRAGRPLGQATSWFGLPDGLFFHQGHSWARPVEEDVFQVGIDDFAQKLIGRPASVLLPNVGSRLRQGSRALSLKIGSKTIDLLSPVDGRVVSVNRQVSDHPETINEDPYGQGWCIAVQVEDKNAPKRNLLSGRLALSWLEETVHALQLRLAGQSGPVLQDGGALVTGFARVFSPEDWDEMAREFLLSD